MKSLFLCLVLVFTMTGFAQEYRGTILGRITDPSGAAIAGASVTVQNVETKVAERASSNETGNYQVPFLVPGNYTVTVEHTVSRRSSGRISGS